MTKTRHGDGSKAGDKKPRFTGRGTEPRAGGRRKAPGRKEPKEPCPKSRAKRETENQEEYEAGASEAGTDHERKETHVVSRDGGIAHEERETT